MSYRSIALAGCLGAVIFMSSPAVLAQSSSFKAPRTGDGQPDLQGVWGYETITPMERPRDLADKPFFTPEEAAAWEARTNRERDNDRRDEDANRTRPLVNGSVATADVARAYNQFWWDFGNKIVGNRRTSLIVDPPDGRFPALTAKAKAVADDRQRRRDETAAGPEDRGLGERCINWGVAGPPMRPGAYNNNVQIFQNKDYVVLLNEMIHDARIIPLDGRPFGKLRQWQGESRAKFEGDTLVVETINFRPDSSFNGSDENMRLTERFTRTSKDALTYTYTIDNPTAFTKPLTVEFPMYANSLPIYEYACHEGNYGMEGILSGARAIDKATAEAAKRGSN